MEKISNEITSFKSSFKQICILSTTHTSVEIPICSIVLVDALMCSPELQLACRMETSWPMGKIQAL